MHRGVWEDEHCCVSIVIVDVINFIIVFVIVIVISFLGSGKCIVEFEKMSTAVMEDVGTFNIKIIRLGDASNQVMKLIMKSAEL